jgi:hypothetical protein
LILIGLALGACGGGSNSNGGGGDPPQQVSNINEQNLAYVGALTYNSGVLLNFFTDLSVAGGVQSRENTSLLDLKSLIHLEATELLQTKVAGAQVAGVVTQEVQACKVSGGVTIITDDADNNGGVSVGDKVTFQYGNCVTTLSNGTNITRNGVVSSTLTKLAGQIDVNTNFESGLDMSFDSFSVTLAPNDNVFMQGNLTSSTVNNPNAISTNSVTIAALQLNGKFGALSYRNYQFNESLNNITKIHTESVQGTMFTMDSAGEFQLTTLQPFQGVVGGNPSVGKLKIVGTNSTAYLTAVNVSNALLELDKGSNGTIDFVKPIAWSDL